LVIEDSEDFSGNKPTPLAGQVNVLRRLAAAAIEMHLGNTMSRMSGAAADARPPGWQAARWAGTGRHTPGRAGMPLVDARKGGEDPAWTHRPHPHDPFALPPVGC
jgi:hypothetical protein